MTPERPDPDPTPATPPTVTHLPDLRGITTRSPAADPVESPGYRPRSSSDLPSPGAPADLPQLPGYDIEAELGRGGMGVVYRAHDRKLNRTVAIKMVLGGGIAGPSALVRFLTEAEALAALDHPNVVHVYDRGEYQ